MHKQFHQLTGNFSYEKGCLPGRLFYSVYCLNFIFVDMSMNQIRLFNIFRKEMHLSDASAEEAVSAMQELAGFAIESKMHLLATKEVAILLKEDKSLLKPSMFSLKEEMILIKEELKKELHTTKVELRKAIYLSCFIQIIAMVGTVLAVVKFIK